MSLPLRPPAYVPPAVARYRLQNREAAPKVLAPFWQFRDAADGSTELMIYAEIGFSWWDDGVTAADFAKELQAVKTKNLVLRINSPGGDVFDGLAIGNLLAEHPATKIVKVDALAASIASVIAVKAGTPTRQQPGNKIIMGRQSQMMIHDASGFAMGNAADMREMADLLDMISDNIAAAYSDRAGGEPKDWRKTMKGERWYTDAETVEAGLADEVVGADDGAMESCPECDGTGKKGGKDCPGCDGSGQVPADDGEAEDKISNKVCDTCDGSGKIKKGSTKCPDCDGTGKMADDLADMIRRAYAPAAGTALRPAAVLPYDRGGWLPPAVRPVPEARQRTTDDGVVIDLDGGLGNPPDPIAEVKEIDWTAGLADQLKNAAKAATAPPTVDVADWRETFATFRNNMPAVKDRPAPPTDLGPRPAPVAEPPRNELADAIRDGIGVARVNQPRPTDDPAPPAPVDLGPPPERPAPAPETPRNPLADLIGGAVDLAAKDQPEPTLSPAEPVQNTDNPPFRLDVEGLRRAVRESRF